MEVHLQTTLNMFQVFMLEQKIFYLRNHSIIVVLFCGVSGAAVSLNQFVVLPDYRA
jgi:hypothetical protein